MNIQGVKEFYVDAIDEQEASAVVDRIISEYLRDEVIPRCDKMLMAALCDIAESQRQVIYPNTAFENANFNIKLLKNIIKKEKQYNGRLITYVNAFYIYKHPELDEKKNKIIAVSPDRMTSKDGRSIDILVCPKKGIKLTSKKNRIIKRANLDTCIFEDGYQYELSCEYGLEVGNEQMKAIFAYVGETDIESEEV